MSKVEFKHLLLPSQENSELKCQQPCKKDKRAKRYKSSSEEEFEPQYHTMKKLKLPINRSRLSKGNWSLDENKIYLAFLLDNKQHFITQAVRRQQRVFCQLSDVLRKKRTPDQCRSHHQKLLAKNNESIEGIIRELTRKIKLNGVKEQPYFKTRLIGKYKMRKMNKKSEEFKHTNIGVSGQESDLFERLRHCQERIKDTVEKQFFKTVTFQKSGRIVIQIDEVRIKSY